ncbi:MAG: flagellar hook-length control protein FliK, partial [Actinomycetota bacterium]|nr:flagellar hook-length control protein FliK [Actinomycetota bacterium]
AGTGPSAPVAPTAGPAAVPAQLVQVVAPFREAPDGTHHLTLRLRPDELGEVRMVVQVRAGEVSLHLTAESSGTADILRTSLPDLRAELEAGGFRAGSLDVGTGEQPPTRRHGRPDLAEPALGPAPPPRATSPASGSGPAGLDIRL